jgi:hypothetical protein
VAEIVYPPQWSDERYRSAYRQGFSAGVTSARINARQRDPEYAELQRWALEQADRADAAEAVLKAMENQP